MVLVWYSYPEFPTTRDILSCHILPKLECTGSSLAHGTFCMYISCCWKGSPWILGRIGVGKSDVMSLLFVD